MTFLWPIHSRPNSKRICRSFFSLKIEEDDERLVNNYVTTLSAQMSRDFPQSNMRVTDGLRLWLRGVARGNSSRNYGIGVSYKWTKAETTTCEKGISGTQLKFNNLYLKLNSLLILFSYFLLFLSLYNNDKKISK